MDSTAYFVLLFVHLASLVLALGAVLVIDVFGLLWLFRRKGLEEIFRVAEVTQVLIWAGWCLLVATGVPLLVMKGLVDDLVKLKLFLVALAGLNGLFLDRIKAEGRRVPDMSRPPARLLFRIGLGTAVSQLSWWGAMLIGFYQGNVEHVVRWPRKPGLWVAVTSALILAACALGTAIFRDGKPAPPAAEEAPPT